MREYLAQLAVVFLLIGGVLALVGWLFATHPLELVGRTVLVLGVVLVLGSEYIKGREADGNHDHGQ